MRKANLERVVRVLSTLPLVTGSVKGFCDAQGIPLAANIENELLYGPTGTYVALAAGSAAIMFGMDDIKMIPKLHKALENRIEREGILPNNPRYAVLKPKPLADYASATGTALAAGTVVGLIAGVGTAAVTAIGYGLGYTLGMATR